MPTAMINKKILLLIAAILSIAASISGMAFLDTASEEFMSSREYALADSSNNNSSNNSITLASQEKLISTPQNLSPGSGYYSSHPIAMNIGSGSRTVISNDDSATSMSHEVGSAREFSSVAEYGAQSSGLKNAFGESRSATTHMSIDESVTSGRVNIGVLVGEGSQNGAGQSRFGPGQSAWRDPAIEMEEEYVGTYNISKNFTVDRSYSAQKGHNGWLDCCGDNYTMSISWPKTIRADDVFNCYRG